MADEIIEELWRVKDGVAREHGYDLDALVADLRAKKSTGRQRIENLHSVRTTAEQGASPDRFSGETWGQADNRQ